MPTTEELQAELQGFIAELEAMEETFRNNDDTEDGNPFTTEERAAMAALRAEIDEAIATIARSNPNFVETAPNNSVSLHAPLGQAVGKNSPNHPADVQLVIGWLNNWGYSIEDGADEATLIATLESFQKEKLGFSRHYPVDPGGRTWSILSAAPTDLRSLETGDTPTENQLMEFQENATYIGVQVAPGQDPIRVTPPYVNVTPNDEGDGYRNRVYNEAVENRKVGIGPRVHALMREHGVRDAKASIASIQSFLQAAVAEDLVPEEDRTEVGLRNFLIRYGVGIDCNGLAFQALNHLKDGNYNYEPGIDPYDMRNNGLYKHEGGYEDHLYDIITSPSQLRAGDLMYLHDGLNEKGAKVYRHVRVITDIDVLEDGRVIFVTLESGSTNNIVDALYQADRASGTGDQHWRYDSLSDASIIWNSADGGDTWSRDYRASNYVYYRPK